MVAALSEPDRAALKAAAESAMQETSAKISIIVTTVSDDYYDFILLYSLIAGGICGFLLWAGGIITDVPGLLAFQAVLLLCLDGLPWLRSACVALVPSHIRHQRGAREAMRQYQFLTAALSHDTPFVELYISLIDKYVEVRANPCVHQALPAQWDVITSEFSSGVYNRGLCASSAIALKRIGEVLTTKFPKEKAKN